ncbi:MAG: hypothetical protein ACR2MC_07935 [Actinomycetota bacterium]
MPFVGPEGAVVASAEHVPEDLVPHARAVPRRDRIERFEDVQVDAYGRVAFVFQHREVPLALVGEQARAVGIVTGTAECQQRHRGVVGLGKPGRGPADSPRPPVPQ